MHECNTKQIFIGDDRSLSVVEFGIVLVDKVIFVMHYVFQEFPTTFLSFYQITHSSEGKIVTFTPHEVVIKDFKNPQNVLATGIVDDITGCTNLTTLGHHLFLQFLLLIVIT